MLADGLYALKETPIRSLPNTVARASSLFLLPIKNIHTPSDIQIEPTSRCNMSCFMCGRPYLNRENGDMDPGQLEQILGQFPHLKFVTMQGLGEPLLHPGFEDLLQICLDRSVRVRFSTNALVLDDTTARMLIEKKVHQVSFSIDAVDPEIYRQIRKGGRIGPVLENIGLLAQRKSVTGSIFPAMEIDIVSMRSNLQEIPRIVREASRLGIKQVNVRQMYSMHSSRLSEGDPRAVMLERIRQESLRGEKDRAMAKKAYLEAQKEGSARGVKVRVPFTSMGGAFRCPWPWIHTYIDYQGNVTPCCVCPNKDEVCFGNIHETGFKAIWNGEGYTDLRRRMRTGNPPPYCRGCVRAVNEGLRTS